MDAEDPSAMETNPSLTILATPTSDQDSLSPLAEEDTEMADGTKSVQPHGSAPQRGVRIDDHYYFSDDGPVSVKKAANDYQAAWYISDSSDSNGSDNEDDNELEMDDISDNESETYSREDESEADDTSKEMHVDLSPEEEEAQYCLPLVYSR